MADHLPQEAAAGAETPRRSGLAGPPESTPRKPLPILRHGDSLPSKEWEPEVRFMSNRGSSSDPITQDYTAIGSYVPRDLWDQARRGVPDHQRLEEWFVLARQLGLRHPSEHTTHRLVALYLLANRGDPDVAGMSPVQKASVARVLKGRFKDLTKKEGRRECLVSLPPDPKTLLLWEETQGLLDAKRPPVPLPFDAGEVQAVLDSFPLRVARGQGPWGLPAAPAPHPGAQMVGVLAQFLQAAQGLPQVPGLRLLPGARAGSAGGSSAGGPWTDSGLQRLALPAPDPAGDAGAPEAGAGTRAGAAPGREEAGEGGAAPAAGAGGEAGNGADAAAGSQAGFAGRTPEEAAGAMLGALRKRPAGHWAGGGEGSKPLDGTPEPSGKRPCRPSCPAEGDKVAFLGGTIRRKATCFFVRIPKELTGKGREWTVERRFKGDVQKAWGGALGVLEERLGGRTA